VNFCVLTKLTHEVSEIFPRSAICVAFIVIGSPIFYVSNLICWLDFDGINITN